VPTAAAQTVTPDTEPATSSAITADEMRATVAFLASPEMKGRRIGTDENRRAAEWIAARFARLGLQPANQGSFFHAFEVGNYAGRNVAGILRSAEASDQYVVVGAHLDGVGDLGGRHRPAADDNASGVAALLEIAAAFVAQRQQLTRNVVFAAYDAEEVGLIGSTAFVHDEVIPSEDTVFTIIFDMIGGRFFPWQPKQVIAMGSEHSPQVRQALIDLSRDRATRIERIGTYVLEPAGPLLARSDYRAYRKARVPYLFFSTGTPWYYHLPDDTVARIDFDQAAEIAQVAFDIAARFARGDHELEFVPRPQPEVHDLRGLRRLTDEILAHRSSIRLPDKTFAQIEKMRDALDSKIEKGQASRALAHRALILIFEAAKHSKARHSKARHSKAKHSKAKHSKGR
jgi:Zn-dependent M28 family amino/carboxypeptidase